MNAKNLYYCTQCKKEGENPYWHKGRIGQTNKLNNTIIIKKRCSLHTGIQNKKGDDE